MAKVFAAFEMEINTEDRQTKILKVMSFLKVKENLCNSVLSHL